MKMNLKMASGIFGAMIVGAVLMFGGAKIVYPGISSAVGLAVAQTSTVWNNVKDAIVGDGISSGVLIASPGLFNGTSFDRVRGDTTYGMDVDITRMSGSVTPSDAYANPTTTNDIWALLGSWNGATWERNRSIIVGDGVVGTGIPAAGLMVYGGSITTPVYNRMRGVGGNIQVMNTQGRSGVVTSQSVSAVASSVAITISVGTTGLAVVTGIDAYCSAGTSGITIARATGPTTIWSTPATGVGTTLFSKEWPTPMTSSVVGDNVTVTLASCGVGNTGTLMVRGTVVV